MPNPFMCCGSNLQLPSISISIRKKINVLFRVVSKFEDFHLPVDAPDSQGTDFTMGFPPHELITDPGGVYDVTRLVLLVSDDSTEADVTISGPMDAQVRSVV